MAFVDRPVHFVALVRRSAYLSGDVRIVFEDSVGNILVNFESLKCFSYIPFVQVWPGIRVGIFSFMRVKGSTWWVKAGTKLSMWLVRLLSMM